MKEHTKRVKKLWMRILVVALCLVMALGTTVTIMASSFDGDLDGDGKITAYDAQLLAEYQAGNRDLDPATVIGLTVRGILDRVLGLIVDEPVEDDGNVETTVEVRADENGFVTEELTFTEENVTVTVPVGVKVTGTELTLTVTKKDASEGGVTAEEGQELLPMDIHVEGVAADNTVALIICVAGALDTGLNLGNLTVYHVENGELVAMTQVTDIATLSSHNSFYYDPVTGDVTIAMATFSEVALVADEDKAWQGMFADAFAGGTGTENDPYLIANADQLAYMSKLVSNDEEAASAHYKLIADVNLNGIEAQKNDRKDLMFYPIGYWAEQGTNTAGETYYGRGNTFTGTFDGNGNTIANIYQNTWLMDGDYDNGYWNTAMGLFGAVWDTTIKNLTMDNFQCDGETAPVGCIATYAGGPDMVFENIQLTNSNPRTYNVACGGIAGYNYNSTSGTADKITFRNITVDQTNKITALWGTYGVSGGSLLGRLRDNSNHDGTNTDGQKNVVYMENCHMATIMDVNNDCCSNYQWYLYCYAGMVIGTVDYIDQVPEVGIEDVVTAVDCTVTYGDWNEYWYCELVKNTIASYTHDHQFGRLTEITDVSEIQDENGNWNQEGGFVIANADNTEAECFHIFKHSEGYLYRHFHDVEDETNPDVYETTDVDGDGVIDSDLLKEDHQCYYIPFAQLWIGYNRGCSPLYTFEGIEIKDGGTVKSAPKFAAKDVSSITTESTVKLSDLFEAVVDETRISKSALNVFVSPVGEDSTVSAVYAADNGNWGNGTLTFSGVGTAKIVITDYFYCTETVLNVSVIEMSDAVKFEKAAAAQDSYETETTVTVGELFTALQDAEIDAAAVQVTVSAAGNDSTAAGEYVANTNDWTQGTLTFSGLGAATITITDYNFCTPTTINVEIIDRQPEEKFDLVFKNTDEYLYRVGNANGVSANSLFKLKTDATIVGNVNIDFFPVTENVSGSVTPSTTWTSNTIQFAGTGLVEVQISDEDPYCKPTVLMLEIVDAWNTTTAINAPHTVGTRKYNVVLLNDIGSGFTVSGDYTFYGNGFTLNYTGNGQYLNNGLKQGVVNVFENGTLDNLRIVASIYPSAYLYYSSAALGEYVQAGPSTTDGTKIRYHYQLSAVTAKDNATISNCYIYGGRTNIFVNTGDVTVKDTVLECGVVANMQIQSNASHVVTLENVTTIQYQVNPTLGDTSKIMLGAGVIVGPETTENPKIVLNGDFKQYNWVTADDEEAVSDEVAQKIIGGALDATAFNHTIDGKTASNLGIIYMNTYGAAVENNTGLPYEEGAVKIQTVTGTAYSLVAATDSQINSDYANADKNTVNGLYEPQFKLLEDLGGQYIENTEGCDEYCYAEGKTVNVMFVSGDTKELDLAAMVAIEKYSDQDLNLAISCKDSSGNAVTVTDGKITLSEIDDYTVTYHVTDTLFYDKNGVTYEETIAYTWDVILSVSLKDNSTPDAYFAFDSTKQKMGYYKPSLGDVKQYLPFLAGLKIYDFNGQTEYLRFDGDADYNKVASVTITGYTSNEAYIEVKLTDGGVINTKFLARADSGGASTYTGSIKTQNNTIYFVNGGGTSNSASTTTSAYWYVDYYKFTGNNGVAIQSAQQTFNSSGSSASTPSGSFSTTIKYTVTYNANEGTCGQTVGYATSASEAVTLPTPSRSGYIFAGWYTAASGGTKAGGAGETYTPSSNLTLYAQWGKPCTVTYNANGGSCGTASAKYTGTALTLPEPTRDGYWFIGWYDAAEGGNKVGDAGAPYNPGGDITLYAHWQEAVQYTVTYNANEGTVSPTSATYEGTALTLPTPNRTGYTFQGWFDAASGGTKKGNAGESYIPAADITLYAQWKINSYTIKVTTSNATVKVNGTAVSNNGTVSIQYGAQVTVEVTYSETDSQSTTIKGTDGTTYTSPFNMPAQEVTINATSSAPSCVTGDTLITLADGSQMRVDALTGSEELLVWNLETGSYDTAPIVFVDNEAETEVEVVNLYFSDGSKVGVIYEHGFFDYKLGEYVYIDAANAQSYVGHRFVTQGNIETGTWSTAILTKVEIEKKVEKAYSPVTFSHLCYYTDGVLSMPGGIEGLFNIFDVDTAIMAYDAEKKAEDIANYGLYTYADFADLIPEEAFYAFNGAYLKVAIAKGLLTWEDIAGLAERYVPLM